MITQSADKHCRLYVLCLEPVCKEESCINKMFYLYLVSIYRREFLEYRVHVMLGISCTCNSWNIVYVFYQEDERATQAMASSNALPQQGENLDDELEDIEEVVAEPAPRKGHKRYQKTYKRKRKSYH